MHEAISTQFSTRVPCGPVGGKTTTIPRGGCGRGVEILKHTKTAHISVDLIFSAFSETDCVTHSWFCLCIIWIFFGIRGEHSSGVRKGALNKNTKTTTGIGFGSGVVELTEFNPEIQHFG